MEEILRSTEIKAAQDRLDRELKRVLPDQGPHTLGYRGGGKALNLFSRGKGDLYYASVFIDRAQTAPRFWNAFGFYDGLKHGSQRIVVEINIPTPPNRRVAGFFAKDSEAGEIYVLHDGRIGGGKVGVSRDAFLKHAQLKTTGVKSGRGSREAVIVGRLGDPNIVQQIQDFASAVVRFKESLDRRGITHNRR